MKNFIIALVVLTGFHLQAQKTAEKQVDYQDQKIELDFDLASEIEIRSWDKASILVKATVESNNAELEELFELLVKEDASKVEIRSNSKEILDLEGNDGVVLNRNSDHEINYTVFIPQGVELKLSSITGNVISEYLDGDISIDVVTGDLDIRKFKGDLELNTVTGKIYLPAKDTSFKAQTVMGQIFVGDNPDLVKKEQLIGQEIALNLQNSKNRLRLKTVTGDIHLE